MKSKRYLGAFLADDYMRESLLMTRTFVKGKLESVPVRPLKYYSFINRILQAFDVLIGRADALYWWQDFEDEQDRLEKHSDGDPDSCVVCNSKLHKQCDNFPV